MFRCQIDLGVRKEKEAVNSGASPGVQFRGEGLELLAGTASNPGRPSEVKRRFERLHGLDDRSRGTPTLHNKEKTDESANSPANGRAWIVCSFVELSWMHAHAGFAANQGVSHCARVGSRAHNY